MPKPSSMITSIFSMDGLNDMQIDLDQKHTRPGAEAMRNSTDG